MALLSGGARAAVAVLPWLFSVLREHLRRTRAGNGKAVAGGPNARTQPLAPAVQIPPARLVSPSNQTHNLSSVVLRPYRSGTAKLTSLPIRSSQV
jgi:hypothetical protein